MANDKQSFMLVVAGFFGSLVTVSKARHNTWKDNLAQITVGTSSAYFLTPLVFSVTGIDASPQTMSAMAFLLGVLGQRGIELLLPKIFGERSHDADASKPES